MQKIRVLTTAALALVIFLSGGGVMKAVSAENDYDSLRRFSQILDMVEQYYVNDVSQKELLDGAIKGMLQNLDPHSTLMTEKEFQEMQENTSGEFFGVGVEITVENGQVMVVSPIEDTPGYKAGLRAGDAIIAVDGQYTMEMSLTEVVAKMRGKRGTTVELQVLHKNGSRPVTMKIKRHSAHQREVARTGAGLLVDTPHPLQRSYRPGTCRRRCQGPRQGRAQGHCSRSAQQSRRSARSEAWKWPTSSLKTASSFPCAAATPLPSAPSAAHVQKDDVDCPLVVLVNSGSASASEIVAGALRDQKRALILGERTFGKGSVQNLIPLADGAGLKLTVARYYTPSGKSIQAEGIVPDFEVAWEAPREEASEPALLLREKDLRGHLEQKADKTEERKDDEKADNGEDISAMLSRDNQLRLALQFVKTLPVLKSLKN